MIIRIRVNDITAAGCIHQFFHTEGGGIGQKNSDLWDRKHTHKGAQVDTFSSGISKLNFKTNLMSYPRDLDTKCLKTV